MVDKTASPLVGMYVLTFGGEPNGLDEARMFYAIWDNFKNPKNIMALYTLDSELFKAFLHQVSRMHDAEIITLTSEAKMAIEDSIGEIADYEKNQIS